MKPTPLFKDQGIGRNERRVARGATGRCLFLLQLATSINHTTIALGFLFLGFVLLVVMTGPFIFMFGPLLPASIALALLISAIPFASILLREVRRLRAGEFFVDELARSVIVLLAIGLVLWHFVDRARGWL